MQVPSENVNLFRFPLNITVVDDDIDYLDLVQQHLKDITLTTYNSPVNAITNIRPIHINVKDFLEDKFIGAQDLNYKNIENFVKCSKNAQGILIVDYDMPEMNGIELFSKYNDPNLIKILLTNTYSIEGAVDALHDKLISHYLPKERIGILLDVINKLQDRLFTDLTHQIISFLDTNSLSFLFDKDYIYLFNSICEQYKVTKYHILNSYGHYYLENIKDKFIFSIYNSNDLLEIAKDVTESEKFGVEQGHLIPSYFSNEGTEYKLIEAKNHNNYSYCIEKYTQL